MYKNPHDPRAKAARRKWYHANKERQLKRQAERKQENRKFLQKLKESPCTDCGGTFHFSAMDFDHLPQYEKKLNLTQAISHSRKVILNELEKCELVCSNCHRVRTYNRLHLTALGAN